MISEAERRARSRERSAVWRATHAESNRAYQREWARNKRESDPGYRERRRVGLRKWRYGVADARTGGTCEICGDWDPRIHLDHDHQRGMLRGWLCGCCNRGLGHFKDDPLRLLAAALYLKRTSGAGAT